MTLTVVAGCTPTPANPWSAAAPVAAGVSPDRRTLYLEMDEGTHTASDPCFKRYRGSVVVHGRRVDVQLQSRQNEPVICAVPGVGDWFVRMRLDRPLPSGAVVHAPPPFRRDGWKVFPYAALLGSHGPHFLTLEPPG